MKPRWKYTAAIGPNRPVEDIWKRLDVLSAHCKYIMDIHHNCTPLQIYSNNSNMPGSTYTAASGPDIDSDVGWWIWKRLDVLFVHGKYTTDVYTLHWYSIANIFKQFKHAQIDIYGRYRARRRLRCRPVEDISKTLDVLSVHGKYTTDVYTLHWSIANIFEQFE